MSFAIKPDAFADAEKIFSSEDMYRLGLEASTPSEGQELDRIAAHKWFNLAALEGNELAREYRQQLTMEMSQREVAEAQRQARQYLASNRPVLAAI